MAPDTPPNGDAFDALAALTADGAKPKAEAAQRAEGKPRARRKPTSRQAPTPRTSSASLEKRLTQTFTTIAVLVSAFDPVCGATVNERASDLAGAWARLAAQDPRVRKALEALMSGGAYGEALFMTALTIIPILRHHGLLAFDIGGMFGEPADVLSVVPNDEPIPEDILTP